MAKKRAAIVKSDFLCAVFEISQPTLTRWVQSGCPKEARNEFDFRNVLMWFLENIYENKKIGDQNNIADAKLRFWKAKGEREALKAATERGELERSSDIERDSTTAGRIFRDACLNIPSRCSAIIAAKSKKKENEIYQLLRNEINASLHELIDSLKKIGENEKSSSV